jgi:YgiT-type zinc finger domain-containing protein
MEKCALCGGKTKHKKVDIPTKIDDKFIVLKGVPAYVCSQCDEIYYDIKVARALEEVEDGVLTGGTKMVRIKNAYEIPLAIA